MKNKKIIIIGTIIWIVVALSIIFIMAVNQTEVPENKNNVIIGNTIPEPDRIIYRNAEGKYFEFLKGEDAYTAIESLLNNAMTTCVQNGEKITEEQIDNIHQTSFIEFDYQTISKNYIFQLTDNEKQAVIKLATEGGNVFSEKLNKVGSIIKKLDQYAENKPAHTLAYKEMLSKNTLDTFDYKYHALFHEVNYKILQVTIHSMEEYDKFIYMCNLSFEEPITEETFENHVVILTVTLVPKIEVKVNLGNIRYTFDRIENANYQYYVHALVVDKIVNTDCIYQTDLSEIANKIDYDNMKVSYDEAVDKIDDSIFVTDFDAFMQSYKTASTSITQEEAAQIAEKGFTEAERICGAYDKNTQTVTEKQVRPNNFFTRKITEGDTQASEMIEVYAFTRVDDMELNGVEIYVDKKLGKIVGGGAFGD